ncbi:disease resistance RPM1-like [Olea europaea subsp. europaea]|uniref:Disease resistance RPM1-like n=1 Tax=Olea europaea subsp. europaea TaxID=158383 RepID=A0A8S0VCL0_OLEEU|nr:disease resistance RPM1-like [Olea europaea subsp. europaea]
MAETAISSALVSLQMALPAISLHLNRKKGDRDEGDMKNKIENIIRLLRRMKAFIEDNDDLIEHGSRLRKDQVEQVRDIAYEIEDVLEDVSLHSMYEFRSNKIIRKSFEVSHNIKHGYPLREISDKITSINKNIELMGSQMRIFDPAGYPPSRDTRSSGTSTARVQLSPLLLDDELVGYKKPKEEFVRQLIDDRIIPTPSEGEKGLVRIAVVGPGGSGKSTFVKNVFWKRNIFGQFDCHAWVHVSRHFDVKELLSGMLDQFRTSRKEPYHREAGDILTNLRNYLMEKSYVVVLDDIWRVEHYECIMNALPDDVFGSRIIVTTRAHDVASSFASSNRFIHNLNGLEWLDAWTLFCKKAFHDSNGECPSELKDCSNKIVKRCEGLPLAISAVGAVLSQKPKYPDVWEKFHAGLGYEIGSSSYLSGIGSVLLSGYKDLSSDLKSCFLYFSIFPEDYSVDCGRLVRLWVAERFVMETDGKTAEEVAEDYLNQLIMRNLVHVSGRNFDGRPKNCRVLNLLREFIVQKCKDENFVSVFSKQNSPNQKVRRLSVQSASTCSSRNIQIDFPGVRSMFLFSNDNSSLTAIENKFQDFRLLRISDLQGSTLKEFPKKIVHLGLLKYLSFRDTEIEVIPKSIKKLYYLETLDLKRTNVIQLPKKIRVLKNLRHLFASKKTVKNFTDFDSIRGVKVFEGIKNLTNLQALSLVKVCKSGRIIRELQNLSQLRKLGLTGIPEEFSRDLCESIEKMKNLNSLDLSTTTKKEYLQLGELVNPPKFLQRLYLKGRLEEFPRWISSLDNLFKIVLKWSKLYYSPLNSLLDLRNLMELQLVDCYVGKELVFEDSSFQKLKKLVIEELPELDKIVFETNALPELQQISLRRCQNLKMPPLGISKLANVEELTVYDMNQEFMAAIRKGGEGRVMIEHIPVIHSFTHIGSFENLSYFPGV